DQRPRVLRRDEAPQRRRGARVLQSLRLAARGVRHLDDRARRPAPAGRQGAAEAETIVTMSERSYQLFEISWEVCNKVGGIHTVLSSKAVTAVERFGDDYITVGPQL